MHENIGVAKSKFQVGYNGLLHWLMLKWSKFHLRILLRPLVDHFTIVFTHHITEVAIKCIANKKHTRRNEALKVNLKLKVVIGLNPLNLSYFHRDLGTFRSSEIVSISNDDSIILASYLFSKENQVL